jgi:hypothetical protein
MTTRINTIDDVHAAAADHRSIATRSFKRVSWAAIFAGGIVALVVQLLLTLLGTGIGLSTVDPLAQGATPDGSSLGIGAAVWWAVSSVIALFAGGWTAGHLAGVPTMRDSVIHGVLTWGIATLVAVYLVSSSVGALVRGASSVVGGVASLTATGAAAAAAPVGGMVNDQMDASAIDMNSLKTEAMKLLGQTGKPALQPGAIDDKASTTLSQVKDAAGNAAASPQSSDASDAEFGSLLDKVMKAGKDTASQVDKEAVVNVVMNRAGVSKEEAARRVDAWMKTYQQTAAKAARVKAQAVQQAKEAADATAKATSRAAFGGFIALLLGALAAGWGGAVGRPRAVVALS